MIGWLVRATVGTVILGVTGYTIVAVPVGRRTLFEHGVAIFHTQPAQELAEDLSGAAAEAVDQVRSRLAQDAAKAGAQAPKPADGASGAALASDDPTTR